MKKFLKNFLLFLKLHRFSIFMSLILATLWKTQIIKFHWIWIFCPFWIPWILVVFVILFAIITCYIDIILTGLSTKDAKIVFTLIKTVHKETIKVLAQVLNSWIWK